MKKILSISVLLALFSTLAIVGQVDQKVLFEQKIKSYTNLRNTGTVVTIAGAGATAAGIGILVSYFSDELNSSNNNNGYYGYDTKYIAGLVCAELGLDLIIAGAVMASIGSKKVKLYKMRLNQLTVGMKYTPERKSLTLTYRF